MILWSTCTALLVFPFELTQLVNGIILRMLTDYYLAWAEPVERGRVIVHVRMSVCFQNALLFMSKCLSVFKTH